MGLRDAFFLTRKDTAHLFRARETWLWTFFMPIVFFYFIGTVTGNAFRGTGKQLFAVYAAPEAGWLADELIRRIEARGYGIRRATSAEEAERFATRMLIPSGFTASVLSGKPVDLPVQLSSDPYAGQYDEVRVQRAVYGILADLFILESRHEKPGPEALTQIANRSRHVTLDVQPAGRLRAVPGGFQQSVPGTMVMFTLLVLFTSGAVSLTIERNLGVLRRLGVSPISRSAVVLGKWGSRFALGVIQIAFAMIAGTVLFKIDWGPHLWTVVAVLLAYAALAASLGMLLGNFARTEKQVIGIGVISTNILAALGGCWWPIEITPRWARQIALALPTGWAMDALHKLMSFGATPPSVVPHIAACLIAALCASLLIARSFRFQ